MANNKIDRSRKIKDEGLRLVKSNKRSLQIVSQIKSLIESGYFKIEDRLPPERILAEKLGVSRPSVREALCALEIAGLIRRKAGDGNYIIDVSDDKFNTSIDLLTRSSPTELLEVREIIEREIITKVTRSATQEDIERIGNALEKMERAVQRNERGIEEDIDFHLSIAKSLSNSLLTKLFENIASFMYQSLWKRVMFRYGVSPRGAAKQNLKTHRRIFNAIRDHDELKALEALKDSYRPIERYIYED